MSDQTIAQAIEDKGFTAPRITPDMIDETISSEHYFTALDGVDGHYHGDSRAQGVQNATALGVLTFCVLVLQNGFTVTGESACASPENFDAEIGRKIARENAKRKIWPLEGYRLRCKLASAVQSGPSVGENAAKYAPHQQRVLTEQRELADKLQKLTAFLNSDKVENIGGIEIEALREQAEHMQAYLNVLSQRIQRFEEG